MTDYVRYVIGKLNKEKKMKVKEIKKDEMFVPMKENSIRIIIDDIIMPTRQIAYEIDTNIIDDDDKWNATFNMVVSDLIDLLKEKV
jgi:hypothetical protein